MAYWKKIFILAIGVALISSNFPGLLPIKKAGAVFGVGDLVFDPTVFTAISTGNATLGTIAASAAITAGNATSQTTQTFFEWAESFVLSTLKRRILDVMVDQVVTWIQGGGEPKFITDWESFMGDIGQGAVGEFVEQIGAGFLCEPFSLQIQMNLLPVQRFGNNAPFSCTLDDIVQNVEDFYEDFRNGGWIAYNAQWQPQNNYYGALLIAWDARNNYVADKLAAATNNALANKGFLGTKRCYDSDTGQEVSESAISQNARERQVGGGGGSVREFTTGGEVSGSFRSATHTIVCEDTTPGGIVSATLEKAVGTDFDFIINAQQLGDYAAAIVNALVNRLIMEGVNGIRGVHQGGGASYQPSRSAGTTYGGYQSTGSIPSGTRTAISNYSGTSAGAVSTLSRNQLLTRLNAALARRNSANDKFTSALTLAQSYVDITNDTLSCHSTVPALRSGGIHDAVIQKNADANNNLNLATGPVQRNLDAIDELTQTINQINNLTDAQFRNQINEFQAIFINTDASIVNAESYQATTLLEQMQTIVTPAIIADAQRDLDYCVSQGGAAGDRTNGEIMVARMIQSVRIGNVLQFVGRTFLTADGTERVVRRIFRNINPLASTVVFSTKAQNATVPREERMTLQQLQKLAQTGGLRMLLQ